MMLHFGKKIPPEQGWKDGVREWGLTLHFDGWRPYASAQWIDWRHRTTLGGSVRSVVRGYLRTAVHGSGRCSVCGGTGEPIGDSRWGSTQGGSMVLEDPDVCERCGGRGELLRPDWSIPRLLASAALDKVKSTWFTRG